MMAPPVAALRKRVPFPKEKLGPTLKQRQQPRLIDPASSVKAQSQSGGQYVDEVISELPWGRGSPGRIISMKLKARLSDRMAGAGRTHLARVTSCLPRVSPDRPEGVWWTLASDPVTWES